MLSQHGEQLPAKTRAQYDGPILSRFNFQTWGQSALGHILFLFHELAGVGRGAWGVGRGAWGVGRGVWGVGCGACGVGRCSRDPLHFV